MTAHTEYEQTKNRYLELVNRKKELEAAIPLTNDETAANLLRSDYRKVVDELQEIYNENINYFNDGTNI